MIFPRSFLRKADILPTPTPSITIACQGSYQVLLHTAVAQCYVGSVSSNVTSRGLELLRGLNLGHTLVGSYKLPLVQYTCTGQVVAPASKKSMIFPRPCAGLLTYSPHQPHQSRMRIGVLPCTTLQTGVAQCNVGSVSSNVTIRGLEPLPGFEPGSYPWWKLQATLIQYMYTEQVVACRFQQKYDISQVLFRLADITKV
jgi:hypothetical protein